MIPLVIGALALGIVALAARRQPVAPAPPVPPPFPPTPEPYPVRPIPEPLPVTPVPGPLAAQTLPVPPAPGLVPDAVMRVLQDPNAREGELASALEFSRQLGLEPQVAILLRRLEAIRRIIGVLDQADAAMRAGNAVDARGLLIEARSLAVADRRSGDVIATIDRKLTALGAIVIPAAMRAAVPAPSPTATPGAAPIAADSRAQIAAALSDAQAAIERGLSGDLSPTIARLEHALVLARSENRAELVGQIERVLALFRQARGAPVTEAAPSEVVQVPVPARAAPPEDLAALAQRVARNIVRSGRRLYDRNLLRQFQAAAGITVDGKYGPGSREALLAAGVPAAQVPARTLYW